MKLCILYETGHWGLRKGNESIRFVPDRYKKGYDKARAPKKRKKR